MIMILPPDHFRNRYNHMKPASLLAHMKYKLMNADWAPILLSLSLCTVLFCLCHKTYLCFRCCFVPGPHGTLLW